jgi:hypothetical protein
VNLHTEEPGHSHRREHVIYASAQVNAIIVAYAAGKDHHYQQAPKPLPEYKSICY